MNLIVQTFCKEVLTWKALRHKNVLPLLGVMMNNDQFAMVSEWMVNGNINEFVKMHREANRFKLVGPCSYRISCLSLTEPFPIAWGCRSRVDVHARPGDDTCRSEGGMASGVGDHAPSDPSSSRRTYWLIRTVTQGLQTSDS